MNNLFRIGTLAASFVAAASVASAGDLKLTLGGGRVTLVAQDVPVRQILAEWARVGQVKITNAERLGGPALTLDIVDRPEREVLDMLLRSASGYIVVEREHPVAGATAFDRIMIVPTMRAVSTSPINNPQPFINNRPQPMMPPVPDSDDDGPVMPPPGTPMPQNAPQAAPGFGPPQQMPPGAQPPPTTATKPGMLPAPPKGPGGPGGPGGQ